ncbi:uncharacterized protein B0I36DRAFT_333530 [Microdochium trichocladiopsis]|uniref:Uncharacterized protein n=1 Tax=Microdochium trichocladiopsis TaxID=1682393 RepID=A0A9P8XVK0_9PEZI|nr:uncharacterized protein B0I36DRAFT_333530 [Microdochium trichocladiopsis]KAH7020960.1 hypothetical protein B0I36DRAFT_333530 [Microdochium trichocladiopsis]
MVKICMGMGGSFGRHTESIDSWVWRRLADEECHSIWRPRTTTYSTLSVSTRKLNLVYVTFQSGDMARHC